MIARKVKPGILEIIDVKSQDEIESYTLVEISDKDAYLLATSAKQFSKDGNIVTINYDSDDDTDKMFKAIVGKHKKENKGNFTDVSKKYIIDKDVIIPGTSILLRDVKNHVIKVCRRATTNSKEGNINRLFISDSIRDKFFKEIARCKRYLQTNKWELDTQDEEIYNSWSAYMNNQYLEIMKVIKNNKETKNESK